MGQTTTSEPETARDAFPKKGWTADWKGPWSPADESWLGIALQVAEHFEDHDPRDCQRHGDEQWGRPDWKFLREEEHLTLRQLGSKLDVDAGSISRWESGARWPESADYSLWLKESADRLGETARTQVFLLQSKRDGWMTDTVRAAKDDPTLNRFVHWEIIFKDGGLFDRWRESGSLPSWSPLDAGFTGGTGNN